MLVATPRINPFTQRSIYVIEGKDVAFPMCIATGFPIPTVTWSGVFSSLPEKRSFSKKGNLTIVNTTVGDSGMYVCEATNFIGRARAMTQLVVLSIPRFTVKPPEEFIINTGDNRMGRFSLLVSCGYICFLFHSKWLSSPLVEKSQKSQSIDKNTSTACEL